MSVFLLTLLLHATFSSAAPNAYPELQAPVLPTDVKSELKDLQTETGRIVPVHEMPAVQRMVTQVFRRVARAQEDLLDGSVVPINYVFVLESAYRNAFVYRMHPRGVRVATNLVFITTGMLRELFNFDETFLAREHSKLPAAERAGAELTSGLARLGGILGHEVAHPLDTLMTYSREGVLLSIEKEYGKRGSQAAELRADADATNLNRLAHLPTNSVYLAQRRSLPTESPTLLAAGSTHPENSLRRTGARMYLTVQRLRQGHDQDLNAFTEKDFELDAVRSELEAFRIGRGPFPWTAPLSLDQTLDKLRRISRVPFEFLELEYNRLMLTLDRQIETLEANSALDEATALSISDALRSVLKRNDNQPIWDAEARGLALNELGDSRDLLNGPVHGTYLNRLRFYRRPEHARQMRKQFPSAGNARERLDAFFALSSYLPASELLSVYGAAILADYRAELESSEQHARGIEHLRGREFTMALFQPLVRELALNQDEARFLQYMLVSAERQIGMPFFLRGHGEYNDLAKSSERFRNYVRQTRILARGGDREARAAWDFLLAYTKWFWEKRGDVAQVELMISAKDSNVDVDWPLIGEILDLDARSLNEKIAASVKSNLNEANFTALGSIVNHSRYPAVKALKTIYRRSEFDETEVSPMPDWYLPALGRQLVDIRARAVSQNQDYLVGLMVLARAVVHRDPEQMRNAYLRSARAKFNHGGTWTAQNLVSRLVGLEENFERFWWTSAKDYHGVFYHFSVPALAEAIESATGLSEADRRLLLRFCFLRDASFDLEEASRLNPEFFKWTAGDRSDVLGIYARLRRHGVVTSALDLIQQLKRSPHYKPMADVRQSLGADTDQSSALQVYYELVDRMAPTLIAEMHVETWSDLRHATDVLITPHALDIERSHSNSPGIQDIRNALAAYALRLAPADLKERMRYFLDLTASGSSIGADEFFTKHLRQDLLQAGDAYLVWIKGVAMTKRIQSHDLRLELTKSVLEPRLRAHEEADRVRREDLYALVSDIGLTAPQGSLARDRFLESMAWRLKLEGPNLGAFVEDQKTSNWQRENPLLVNAGSSIAAGIHKLSYSRRLVFLEYLMDPAGSRTGLPQEVVDEFMNQTLNDLTREKNLNRQRINRARLEEKARGIAKALKLEIEAQLRDSAPVERIPLIELVLTAGPESLVNRPDYPFNVTRGFLGYVPESADEKGLLSYLSIVEEHETPPSLAYLLSQGRQDKRTIVDIFELNGTVGKKIGQWSSFYEIFGPEIAQESRQLKDRAEAMAKADIRRRLSLLLPYEWRNDVELIRVVAAASVKTVALVRVRGRLAVLHIQPEHSVNQIATNLDLAERLLAKLQSEGLLRQSRMLAALVRCLREQLKEEVDFRVEAANASEARAIFDRLNTEYAAQLKRWEFYVPEPLADVPLGKEFAFYEFADAVTFDDLSPAEQAEVGPLLARATLASVRFGRMNADPHKGNWLFGKSVNGKRKIYAIDWGQFEDFRPVEGAPDPRQALVAFSLALSSRNIEALHQQLVAMNREGEPWPALEPALRQELSEALKRGNYAEQMVQVLNAATEAGFNLQKRYLFGAMKGLMILHSERYASPEEFAKISFEEGMRWLEPVPAEKNCGSLL